MKFKKVNTTQGKLYIPEGHKGDIEELSNAKGLAQLGGGLYWVFIHLKEREHLDISEKLVSIHTSLYLAKRGLEKAIALGDKVTFIKYPSFY